MRPLRPSAAYQWMACGLAAHAPLDRPEEDGDAAREGTCAAWVAECIVNGDATCAADLLGRVHSNGWEVDEEMVRHIDNYVATLHDNGQAEVFMQTPELEGTADHVGQPRDGNVVITDLKYGYRVVEPFENWQLLCYLYLHIRTQQVWPDWVTLRIYQPRAIHAEGPLRKWSLTRAEYEPYILRISNRIEQLIAGEQTAHVGSHCAYCMHALGCQALTQSVYKIADLISESRVYQTPDPQQLSDEYTMLTRMEELFKARKTAVETEMEYRMSNGAFVPGWALTGRYGKKRFTVPPEAIAMITGVDPTEKKTCTPAELLRRGANPEVVKTITETPRIGHKIVPFEGEDKIAAKFKEKSNG